MGKIVSCKEGYKRWISPSRAIILLKNIYKLSTLLSHNPTLKPSFFEDVSKYMPSRIAAVIAAQGWYN
jgi:hypothetical protein